MLIPDDPLCKQLPSLIIRPFSHKKIQCAATNTFIFILDGLFYEKLTSFIIRPVLN